MITQREWNPILKPVGWRYEGQRSPAVRAKSRIPAQVTGLDEVVLSFWVESERGALISSSLLLLACGWDVWWGLDEALDRVQWQKAHPCRPPGLLHGQARVSAEKPERANPGKNAGRFSRQYLEGNRKTWGVIHHHDRLLGVYTGFQFSQSDLYTFNLIDQNLCGSKDFSLPLKLQSVTFVMLKINKN